MKKLILLFFIFSTLKSYGQKVEYSINTGTNYSFFSSVLKEDVWTSSLDTSAGYFNTEYTNTGKRPAIKSKGKFGFYINSEFSFPINKSLAFATGLGFSIKKAEVENSFSYLIPTTGEIVSYAQIADYKLISLEIPVLLQLKLFEQKLRFSGGLGIVPIIQVIVNDYSVKGEFETFHIIMKFGMEYKLIKSIYLGLYFDRNISYLTTNTNSLSLGLPSDRYSETKLNTFSLNLSYKF